MAYESLPKIAPALFSSEQDLIEVYNKKSDTVGVINPSQISTPLPNGVLSVDNPLSSTLQAVEDKNGTPSALNISTQRVGITSDPSVTTQTSSVIQATTTNANLVIAPNGTGALIADIPDGTATGGNARGTNAVDLQMLRSASNMVARGNSDVIAGGEDNKTGNSSHQTIGGGLSNFVNGQIGTIAGGNSNTINNFRGFIGGGTSNTVSSDYGVVSGGQSNTASTGTHATVVGGQGNTSSGNYSISGGSNSTASGARSFAIGESALALGTKSVCLLGGSAQGESSTALAGAGNNALSSFSLAQGYVTETTLRGQVAFSGTGFNFPFERGYCQQSTLVANRAATLNSAATTVLSLDGTGVTNLIIPTGTNRMWNVTIKYVAVVTTITGTATGVTVGDTKSQNIEIGFKKVGGVSSLVGGGSFSIPQENASMGSASLIPTAGASQELALTFTAPTFSGGGSVTCRVVAKIELVEVAY